MFANWLPLYSLQIAISERRRGTVLELAAVITRVFNVMDEEVLGAVVDKSEGQAHSSPSDTISPVRLNTRGEGSKLPYTITSW